MQQNFIFGGNTGLTPEALKQQRALAASLLRPRSKPRNVGEGLYDASANIMGALIQRGADTKDKEMQQANTARGADLFERIVGGANGTPATSILGAPRPSAQSGPARSRIIEGLVSRGMPEHVAEGFAMNFEDESGFDAGINEISPLVPGSRGGFGLAQWTGPRRRQLEAFAAERGVPVNDENMQLDFLMQELATSEKSAANEIFSTQNSGEAAAAIVNSFLRPAEEHRARRTANYLGSNTPQAGNGASVSELAAYIGSPSFMFMTEGQQQIALQMYERALEREDPARQMAMEEQKLRLEQLRNPQEKLTDDQREYRAAVAQGYEGTLQDWIVEMEQAGADKTSITNSTGSSFASKTFEELYDKITKEARSARQMDGMLDTVQAALDTGLETGFGAETALQLRRFGDAIGLDVDTSQMAGAEMLKAITNRMALLMRSPDSGMGMPGAVSDRDLTFLKEAQVGLDRSPEGNRRMLMAFRALNQRKKDIEALADDYLDANGVLDTGFKRQVRRNAEENPLFPEDFFGGQPATPDAETGASSQPTEDGDWRGPSAAEISVMDAQSINAMMSAYPLKSIPDDVLDAIERVLGQ